MPEQYYNEKYDFDGTAYDLFTQVRNGYVEDPEAAGFVATIIHNELDRLKEGTMPPEMATSTELMGKQIDYLCEAIAEESSDCSREYSVGRMKYEITTGHMVGCEFMEEDGLELSITQDRDSIIVVYTDYRQPGDPGTAAASLPVERFMKMDRDEFDRYKNEVFAMQMQY